MLEQAVKKRKFFAKNQQKISKKQPLVLYNFSPLSFCLSVSHIAAFSPSAADFSSALSKGSSSNSPRNLVAPERVYLVGEMLIHFSPATFIRTI